MRLITGSLVDGGNKKYRDLIRGTMKSLFDTSCIRRFLDDIYFSTFDVF
jgi:hypothetical protein